MFDLLRRRDAGIPFCPSLDAQSASVFHTSIFPELFLVLLRQYSLDIPAQGFENLGV